MIPKRLLKVISLVFFIFAVTVYLLPDTFIAAGEDDELSTSEHSLTNRASNILACDCDDRGPSDSAVFKHIFNPARQWPLVSSSLAIYTSSFSESEATPAKEFYKAALDSQEHYARKQGYRLTVVKDVPFASSTGGNIPALITAVSHELRKPADERLKWIFWFNHGVYIVNPKIPLHAFLPPHDMSQINFLLPPGEDDAMITKINSVKTSGVFGVRVCHGSLDFLMNLWGMKELQPETWEPAREDSAIGQILSSQRMRRWRKMVAIVPNRWFNSKQPESVDISKPGNVEEAAFYQPGDLLVPLESMAAESKKMQHFLSIAKVQLSLSESNEGGNSESSIVTELANTSLEIPGIFWNKHRDDLVELHRKINSLHDRGRDLEGKARERLPLMKQEADQRKLASKLAVWQQIREDRYPVASDHSLSEKLLDDAQRIMESCEMKKSADLVQVIEKTLELVTLRNVTGDDINGFKDQGDKFKKELQENKDWEDQGKMREILQSQSRLELKYEL